MRAELGEQYLTRWQLIATPWFRIYLHHVYGGDKARDMHDHPKWFISVGLWGSYIEETPRVTHGITPGGDSYTLVTPLRRFYRAPWCRWFPAEYVHRILYTGRECWTLAIVGRKTREWGFHTAAGWTHHEQYGGTLPRR